MKRSLKMLILLWILLFDLPAMAADRFLIIGVIHSKNDHESVALLKDKQTSRTMAVREGMDFDKHTKVLKISEKQVRLESHGKIHVVGIGGDANYTGSTTSLVSGGHPEISVSGSTVKVTESYRDHLVKNELAKVLMQAAAVPQFNGDQLSGFKLWDIEPDSVYEHVGFQNGDIVTSINEQELIDVGSTIRLLQALKSEPNASVTILRNGKSQTLNIQVQ